MSTIEDQIPTPDEVAQRIQTEWTEEAENLLRVCIDDIQKATSTTITIQLGERISQGTVERVKLALKQKGWSVKQEQGGGQRDPYNHLILTPREQ